ncbi:flagellar protein FlaG [Clostridium sp. SHJSY1]|uniref:flagellar protein FlaG n=1 Tax=Clostridium sp. SHJSY1 TaxID=2942483 RepID=UPI0028750135|nr:flagellar protein FlaG [Clostridium sp. SHJSY1]MDS0524120.1 flagellar protein FlaG [Clostridium sp. SHJSY1]
MNMKVISQGENFNLNTEIPKNIQFPGDKDVRVETSQGEKVNDYLPEDLKKAIDKLNNFLKDEHTHVEYSIHDKFKTVMIKIVDDSTKETIMEVPPKKILDLVAKMCELAGVIYDKKA